MGDTLVHLHVAERCLSVCWCLNYVPGLRFPENLKVVKSYRLSLFASNFVPGLMIPVHLEEVEWHLIPSDDFKLCTWPKVSCSPESSWILQFLVCSFRQLGLAYGFRSINNFVMQNNLEQLVELNMAIWRWPINTWCGEAGISNCRHRFGGYSTFHQWRMH